MRNRLLLDTQRPWDLIRQCPSYAPTPLHTLPTSAGPRILIKDETSRFNLGAFKALGGIYAVAAFLLDRWQAENGSALDARKLFEEPLQTWCQQFTFVCASAGNHGSLNADVIRSGEIYEDSMRAARDECENGEPDKILLADSSWPGYLKIPTLVMEGYTVMAEEMRQHFLVKNNWPSHVFLQAGVGGMAAAIAFHIRQQRDTQPQIIVVEPDAAPCLFESNKRGELTTVQGPVSSMGRLDCKEPSLLAFSALQQYADKFVCIGELDAAAAVTYLDERGIATTPSGAAGVAAILLAEEIGISLSGESTCLAIATEGRG
jgi:diaminopropionate ammonia-lyase